MTNIALLEENKHAAESALRDARAAKKSEYAAQLSAALKIIDLDVAEKYDARIDTLAGAYVTAVKAHEDAVDAAARTGAGAPYPVGTKFIHWDFIRYPERHVKSGTVGVLEVITKDSQHADNIATYRVAALGSVVIRILKKDGQPSKKYERWKNGWLSTKPRDPPYGWHLEDVDPNKPKSRP